MGMPKQFQMQLDSEELFNLYFETPGYSYNKLEGYVRTKYGKNPTTGEFYTGSAVWQAVQRYLIRNYDNPEVENKFKLWYINYELNPPTHEEYLLEVSKRARTVFNPKQYKNWCAKHDDIPFIEIN